jgi:hypothetical protein
MEFSICLKEEFNTVPCWRSPRPPAYWEHSRSQSGSSCTTDVSTIPTPPAFSPVADPSGFAWGLGLATTQSGVAGGRVRSPRPPVAGEENGVSACRGTMPTSSCPALSIGVELQRFLRQWRHLDGCGRGGLPLNAQLNCRHAEADDNGIPFERCVGSGLVG